MPEIRTMVAPRHSCGCAGKPQRDNEAGRAMVAAFALVPCWTCGMMQETTAAAQMAATLGLPDLDGKTEPGRHGTSQVQYAATVREAIRQRMDAAYPDVTRDPADDLVISAVLYGIRDARWWLDRKDAEPYQLVEWIRPVVDVVRGAS